MRVLFKTTYNQDIDHLVDPGERIRVGLVIAIALAAPLFVSSYFLSELAMFICYALAGIGLMVLLGFTGQVSFGHAAFLGIGAYTQAALMTRGIPFVVSLSLAGLIAGLVGAALGRAVSKMHGFYLAVATLAFAIVTESVIGAAEPITGGHMGLKVPPIAFFGYELSQNWQIYYLYLAVLLFVIWGVANLMRAPAGRSMIAVRDSETSAKSLGINVGSVKVRAFFVSAAITGVAGALLAHLLFYLSPETFNLLESLRLMLMVVVGGLGTISGAILGAIFVSFLPNAIDVLRAILPSAVADQAGLEYLVFGAVIALFIIFEPQGIYGRWLKLRLFIETYPYYRRATFIRQKRYLKSERFR
ncbi:branched-chain amino acid ABC transporter permease [Ferrovibrio sp. MS7]|uniref:branched-chain amino acid ABC transporter permease n=1 Tax=Ferrovibrio plantarum TaxID=3119164 RepID=UPI00313659C8